MTNWKLGALAAGLAVALLFPRATRSQAISVNLTGLLTSPAICDGVAYFCSDNGKLYGINASDGTAVPGFPVDITAAVADGSVPNYHTRPGVYYGSLGKAIYVETSKHGVVKVWPNGTVAWINKLADGLPYGDYCTPAVTSQGEVIAEKITADNIYLVKLKESDGTVIGNSPPLANFNYSEVSPPAIANGNIYITVWPNPAAGTDMNTSVLDLADLTVKASFLGSYADNHAPYVRGNGVYIGSNQDIGATVLKLNSATVAPDPLFGPGLPTARPGVTWVLPYVTGSTPGEAEVCASPASADRDPGGTIYASVGLSVARVVAIDGVSGAVRVLYASGGYGSPGLVVSTKNVIAYGDGATLHLFGVDGGHNKSYSLPANPSVPCYDPTTNRFFVTTQPDSTGTSYLLGFDSP